MKNRLIILGASMLIASCGTTSEDSINDSVTSALKNEGKVDIEAFQWTREPETFSISQDTITITTRPHTDPVV